MVSEMTEEIGVETPTTHLARTENPNTPAQNVTLVENPTAPPPLELVLQGLAVASEKSHEAERRNVRSGESFRQACSDQSNGRCCRTC